MPKKRYNAWEIIHKLCEAGVLLDRGKTVSQTCRQTSIGDQTDHLYGLLPLCKRGFANGLNTDRLHTSIRRHHRSGAPKWGFRPGTSL